MDADDATDTTDTTDTTDNTDNTDSTQHRERPKAATREVEARDARHTPDPGRMPTADEEAAAERAERSPEAEEHYREYLEMAKDVPGEGRIP